GPVGDGVALDADEGDEIRPPVPDHAGFADVWRSLEPVLDLARRDVLAARRDDKVLLAVGDPDMLLLVDHADVAGMQPPVLERSPRRLGVLVVTGEDAWAAEEDFAVLGDSDLRLDRRRADRADHDVVGRRDHADGRVLGHAPGLADVDTDRV